MIATRERRTPSAEQELQNTKQERRIAPQTFINIQKTNVDSVVFVSFSFYPLQTAQLYSRACVNT